MVKPEVGKLYCRRTAKSLHYKCVYVGDDYFIVHWTDAQNKHNAMISVPSYALGQSYDWEPVPDKHTVYIVWCISRSIPKATPFPMTFNSYQDMKDWLKVTESYKVVASMKVIFYEGEHYQEPVTKDEEDRSSTGDEARPDYSDSGPRVIDAVTGRDLGSAD